MDLRYWIMRGPGMECRACGKTFRNRNALGRAAHERACPGHPPVPLTETEVVALRRYAATYGRSWKSALNVAWMTGNYGARSDDTATLQTLRNQRGPSWLAKFKLPT